MTKVVVGQTVRMTLYSFADVRVQGKVERLRPGRSDRRTFEIDVKIDSPSDRLAPGMTGELAFVMAEKARGSSFPRRPVCRMERSA